MPLQKLELRPGVNRESTTYANEGGFYACDKIRFRSGLVGGLIAGTLYQIFQFAYLTFQIGVSKYNAIYGSFTALPLFLVWLQLSWIILLFGAEISFAHQNEESYEFEPDCAKISHRYRALLEMRELLLRWRLASAR